MVTKTLPGRLADNQDIVCQAMQRARDADELVPVKHYIDSERWVFRFVKRSQAAAPSPETAASPVRQALPTPVAATRTLLPVLGQQDNGPKPSGHLCPSFSPKEPGGGWIFGVVGGDVDRPRLIPLERPEPVTKEVFEMVAPLHPSQVFRIAAPCVEGRCKNFGGGTCNLAKAVTSRRESTDQLRPCLIRPECLWWHQEGKEACLRCPGVVTNTSKSKAIRDALER